MPLHVRFGLAQALSCVLAIYSSGCTIDGREVSTGTLLPDAATTADPAAGQGGGAPESDAGVASDTPPMCTNEDGVVQPCALPSGCDPQTEECVAPCAGCLIDTVCFGRGESPAGNLCQICDPDLDDSAWSNNDGVSCDDGLYCTVDDSCAAGICTGAPRSCEDGVSCNGVSTCQEESDSCSPFENQCGDDFCDIKLGVCVSTCDGCTIASTCVPDGSELAGNPCFVCNTAVSDTDYTAAVGKACGSAEGVCSAQDTCDAAGVCQPNHSVSGSPCGSNVQGQCDQADTCDGSGNCQPRLVSNSTPCDDGSFCTTGDECQGGRCEPLESRNCGALSACNETTDSCQCQGCSVGGTCFARGARNPANECQICDPDRNPSAFSANVNATCGSAATECSGQDTCNAQGVCQPNHLPNTTRCGASLPASCGNPDVCNGQGICQNRADQRIEVCDGQDNDCDGTTDEGFNLITDRNNCGACGHSCLGAACNARLCETIPLVSGISTAQALAVNDSDVYWSEGGLNGASTAALRRTPRAGGAIQPLLSGRPAITSLALTANQMYWSENDFSASDRRLMRANLNGTGLVRFTPPGGNARTAVAGAAGGFVFGLEFAGLFRSPAVTGNTAAPTPVQFPAPPSGISGNVASIAGGCFVYVSGNQVLQRTCETSSTQLYVTSEFFITFDAHSTDNEFAYFFEGEETARRLQRIRLNGADAGRATTITSPGAQTYMPMVDGNFVYYFRKVGTANDVFACTPGWSLERVAKTPGSQPTTLVPPSQNCPTLLVADSQALYWSVGEVGATDGAIMKLAK